MTRFEPSDATDTELLARFEQARDSSAFAELVRRHGPMVMATTWRNLDSDQDAEDAFQAAFFALAKRVTSIRRRDSLASWLYNTARRTASTIRRSNERHNRKLREVREAMDDVSTEMETTADAVSETEAMKLLDDEISKLPAKLQAVVVLCHLEEMSHEKAGAELGISSSSVSKRLAKARSLLKSKLLARGVTLSLTMLLASLACSSNALSPTLISNTTKQSLLYAAGKSIKQIGAREAVVRTADQVAGFVTATNLLTVAAAGIGILALTATIWATSRGSARTTAPTHTLLLSENFDDGNIFDGSPVNWTVPPDYPGIVDASSGQLVLRTTRDSDPVFGVGIDTRKTTNLRNVSLRTQARVNRLGGTFVLMARGSFIEEIPGEEGGQQLPTAYAAGVTYNPQIGGSLVTLAATVDGVQTVLSATGNPVLNYDIRHEDTVLQLDVFDTGIRVWAWRANGGAMPEEPQYDISNAAIGEQGFMGLGVTNIVPQQTWRATQAVFRFLQVSEVPIHEIVRPARSSE